MLGLGAGSPWAMLWAKAATHYGRLIFLANYRATQQRGMSMTGGTTTARGSMVTCGTTTATGGRIMATGGSTATARGSRATGGMMMVTGDTMRRHEDGDAR